MDMERNWGLTPDARTELMAKARAWTGTQRAFAAAHGISQGTVSKLLSAGPTPTRPATPDLRPEVIARYRAGEGSHRQIADAMGISRGMVSKWLAEDAAERAPEPRQASASRAPTPTPAPTMLEVVPVTSLATLRAPTPAPAGGARLVLPGGAELRFDALPPAQWVADLAAEMSRC